MVVLIAVWLASLLIITVRNVYKVWIQRLVNCVILPISLDVQHYSLINVLGDANLLNAVVIKSFNASRWSLPLALLSFVKRATICRVLMEALIVVIDDVDAKICEY